MIEGACITLIIVWLAGIAWYVDRRMAERQGQYLNAQAKGDRGKK